MQSYQLCFTLFIIVSPVFALKGYDFVFKSVSRKAPRAIPNGMTENFIKEVGTTEVSFCVWLFIDAVPETNLITLLSFLSRKSGADNEFLFEILYGKPYFTRLTINDKAQLIPAVPVRNEWTHLCCTWNGSKGEAHLYFDGERVGGLDEFSVKQIKGDGFLVLGQDQDSYNGGYTRHDGYNGKLTQFNLWNRTITQDEVYSVWMCEMKGNVVNWENTTWTVVDNLEIQWSDAPCMDYICRLRRCRHAVHSVSSPLDITEEWELRRNYMSIPRINSSVKPVSSHSGYYDKRMRNTKGLSVCCWFYFNLTGFHPSYAIADTIDLLRFLTAPPFSNYAMDQITVRTSLNGSVLVTFSGYTSSQIWTVPDFQWEIIHAWLHMCLTWSSKDGKTGLFVNGELVADRTGMATGKVYHTLMLEVMHMQNDLVDDGNFISGVILKAVDVNVWSRSLSPKQVVAVYCNASMEGNLISWNTTKMQKCQYLYGHCNL